MPAAVGKPHDVTLRSDQLRGRQLRGEQLEGGQMRDEAARNRIHVLVVNFSHEEIEITKATVLGSQRRRLQA